MNLLVRGFLGALLVYSSTATYADNPDESADGTHRYVEVNGAKLYTESFGHGAPIVFLHGGMIFFDNNYAQQRDYFAAYRRVIGIDQRGNGHSPDRKSVV